MASVYGLSRKIKKPSQHELSKNSIHIIFRHCRVELVYISMKKTKCVQDAGLPNFGSTCYLNSALQLLFSSSQFMRALGDFFTLKRSIAWSIHEKGFNMVTPYLLSCSPISQTINYFPTNGMSKVDAMTSFLDVVAQRNDLFDKMSGQQSSAEFLRYLLDILRLESALMTRLSLKSDNDLSSLNFYDIYEEYKDTMRMLSSTEEKLDNPVDVYFYSKLTISHKCISCDTLQFKNHSCRLVFESFHRFFMDKDKKSQVTTTDLLNLIFRKEGANRDAVIESFDTCHQCGSARGIEEMKINKIAREVIVIYDRIDSDDTNITSSMLSPTEVISLGQKRQGHWKLEHEINFNHLVEDQPSVYNSRWWKGAIYHNGPTYQNGHYVSVSIRLFGSSSKILLFNDLDVFQDSEIQSLLQTKSSSLIEHYGTAVVALYSTDCTIKSVSKQTKSTAKKRKARATKKDAARKKQKQRVSLSKASLNPFSEDMASILQKSSQLMNRKTNSRNQAKIKGKENEIRFTFDCTHDNYENSPNNFYGFKDFHKYPETAVMLHHLNAGRYAFHNLRDDLSDKKIRHKIAQEIKEEFVSIKDKEKIISDFDMELNGGVNNLPSLLTCGCCGIREFMRGAEKINSRERGGVRYKMAEVRKLTMLQYTEQDQDLLEKKINRGHLTIPVNESGEVKVVQPEYAISYYHDKMANKFYHLHREFVTVDKKQVPHVTLCLNCYNSIFPQEASQTSKNKPKKPKVSLASGFDFGDFDRLGLTEPNKFELCILSKVRKFITILKLTNNMGQRRDYTQQVLKGHAITFDHDAPVVTSTVLEGFDSIKKSFRLQLICEDGKRDHLVEKIFKSSVILGRPFVLRQWLLVLKRINVLYQHDDVPDIQSMTTLTEKANSHLIENIIISTSEKDVTNELRESDDIAQVRSERFTTNESEKGDVHTE